MKKPQPEKRGGGGGRGCSARLPTAGGAAASPSGPSRGGLSSERAKKPPRPKAGNGIASAPERVQHPRHGPVPGC